MVERLKTLSTRKTKKEGERKDESVKADRLDDEFASRIEEGRHVWGHTAAPAGPFSSTLLTRAKG